MNLSNNKVFLNCKKIFLGYKKMFFSYKKFFLIPASILCMVVPFVYKAGFDNTQYFTKEAYMLPFILCGITLVVSLFSDKYGSLALFLASFACLLSFVSASYLYLSSVFFSGIPDTIGAILGQIGFHWSFCIFALVGAMLVGIIFMFLPTRVKVCKEVKS